MLILTADDCRQALTMMECIDGMKQGFKAVSDGSAIIPLRSNIPVDKHQGISLFMPAYIAESDNASLAVKIVSVFNQNPAKGLPLIHAAVLVLDDETGQIKALIEGGSLTAIRTGAASGAATDLLANRQAKVLALFGAGIQAATQMEAVCSVRNIQEIRVYAPNEDRLQLFVDTHRGQGATLRNMVKCSSPNEALAGADIICTATTSAEPVFNDSNLKAGAHINAVGSFSPEMTEIPFSTLSRARVFVDSKEAAALESGEISQGIANNALQKEDILELGQALANEKLGRQSSTEITLFKSVGNAVQDAIAGKIALQNARNLGLGTEIAL